MASNLTIMGNKEILLVAENIAHEKGITLQHAKQENKDIKIDDLVVQELPPIDLNRVVAQVARNEIIRKVKEAEKNKEYNEFKDRIGDIVSASVKKVGLKNIVMEVDGYEAVIHDSGLIPRENFRVG